MKRNEQPVFLVQPTAVGAKILEIAEREREREPDMFIDRNLDYGDTDYRARQGIVGSRIREFFVQGVQGDWATLWDQKSKDAKPPWCAAFASSCYRQAYAELDLPLPMALKANVSGLCAALTRAGEDRLLSAEAVFDSDRLLRPQRPWTPGPGDLVLFRDHVALLRGIDSNGAIHTIEGNTYAFTDKQRPKRRVWGIFHKMYLPDKNPDRWNHLNFGLGASR